MDEDKIAFALNCLKSGRKVKASTMIVLLLSRICVRSQILRGRGFTNDSVTGLTPTVSNSGLTVCTSVPSLLELLILN